MREIKFRAWTNNCWVNNGMLYDYQNTNYVESFGFNDDELPLMQYIGLKDMNDKEIYEGDIFDINGAKYVVEYDERYGGFLPFTDDDGCGCCSSGMTGRDSKSGEVIGNIYQNRELLDDC